MGTSVTLVKQYGRPTFLSLTVSGSTFFTGSFNITGSITTTNNLVVSGSSTISGSSIFNSSIRSTHNTGTGIADNAYSIAKTVLGNIHVSNGAGSGTNNNRQAAITFQGGNADESQAGIYVLNNNSGGTFMGFATTDSYATGPQLFMTATNAGNVSIPRGNLTTIGNIFINNTSPTIYLQDTDHRSSMIHCNSNVFYVLRGSGTNSTSWATFNGYWPMELNLENNNATFGGSITAVGDVTAFSDAKIKKNITTVEKALDKVLQLRGVSYQRTDMESDKTHIGVIAQEVQKILPEVVSENDKGYLNVAYGNIVGVLIEAIKEQQSQIEELKTVINGFTK